MPLTAPNLKQISAIGGFDYTTKAAVPLQSFLGKVANSTMYVSNQVAGPEMTPAGTDVTHYVFVADAPCTVTAAKIVQGGTPTVAPAAAPNDLKVEVKNGATVVATKTYNNVTLLPAAGTFSALTLSGTAANLDLAAGDVLSLVVTQNGLCELNPSSLTLVVSMIPKA